MPPSAIRRALRELQEAAPGTGGLQLVRRSASPWVVRWSLGSVPGLKLSSDDLAREPAMLWTRLVPGDRDRLRTLLRSMGDAAVLEYRVTADGGVRWVRESIRRVDAEGEPALVSFLRDVTESRALVADDRPPAAGLPRVVESGPLVLVVEDDPHVRSVIGRILARKGYGVLRASSAGEALRVWERTPDPVPLMVADVILPDRSGPELARVLTRRDPELRVIFVSGYSVDDLRLRVRLPADAPFLAKPFRAQDLAREVDRAMARSAGGGSIEGPRSAV